MSCSYIAAANPYPSTEPYHLRRKNYLNALTWDEDTEYLCVKVNGQEVEFNFHPGIVTLLNQASFGDEVTLSIELIPFLN